MGSRQSTDRDIEYVEDYASRKAMGPGGSVTVREFQTRALAFVGVARKLWILRRSLTILILPDCAVLAAWVVDSVRQRH